MAETSSYHPDNTTTTTNNNQIQELTPEPQPSSNRRPRGRPPGSKNKPKPPILITRDSPHSLKSHVLEFKSGADILKSLSDFALRRGRAVSILSASGSLSDVSIRQPPDQVAIIRGQFSILSITGMPLNYLTLITISLHRLYKHDFGERAGTVLPPPAPPNAGGLSVFLAGGQGQVIGGNVVGPLLASGDVTVMAASFGNAVYQKLPLAEEGSGKKEEEEEEEEFVGEDYDQIEQGEEDEDQDMFGWANDAANCNVIR